MIAHACEYSTLKNLADRSMLLVVFLLPLFFTLKTDAGIVMVDGTFFGDTFEQDQSWDDTGTTISGI